MTEVPLRGEWFRNLDPEEFSKWADEYVGGKNWNFRTAANSLFNPILTFAREEDAIACKVKFGL